jgi:membrane protein required for colicin V production
VSWNYLDIIFAALLLFMSLRGLFRGALAEFFSVGALGLGIAGAVIFSRELAPYLENSLNVKGWGQIIAFFGIFLAVYVVMKILQKILTGFVETINLENLDKALGFVLGFVEGLALSAAAITVLYIQPIIDLSGPLNASAFAGILLPFIVSFAGVPGV